MRNQTDFCACNPLVSNELNLIPDLISYWKSNTPPAGPVPSARQGFERFIKGGPFVLSLDNDNMVNYTFMTDRGWKVTEYRPFSASYAILHTPCIQTNEYRQYLAMKDKQPETAGNANVSTGSDNLLQRLTDQQLRFNYFSADVLRQLLEERVAIRNRNRSSILSRLSDVSGEIYGASMLQSPEAEKQRQGLEKTRMDLERQLREEDVTLWRDSLEARRELILADKTFSGSKFRQGLMSTIPSLDDNKGQDDTTISG